MNSRFLFATIFSISIIFSAGRCHMFAQEHITPPEFTLEGSMWEDMDIDNVEDFLTQFASYPERARAWDIVGTVIVNFVVTTEGEVTDIQVINSVSNELDAEMIRLVEGTSGMWIPGKIDGSIAPLKKEVSMTFAPDPNFDLVQVAKVEVDEGNKELFENNNPKRALEHYSKAVSILPYEKDLLSLRSLCYYELGKKEEARKDWKRIIDLNMGDRSQLETGYLIVKMKDLEGYDEFQRALAAQ
jgi:TonB family protein